LQLTAIPESKQSPSPPDIQLEQGSKLIKTGNLSFEVSSIDKSKSSIDSLLKVYKAYYQKEELQSYGNRNNYSLLIRVPNKNFETLLSQLENGIGTMNSKDIYTNDVTEEYVDLNIRLQNNLAYLDQYKVILKKAKTIEEILNVQEKIRRIEEEIESKQGRIKYLDNKVSLSTLQVEISELLNSQLANHPSYLTKIQNAFITGIQSISSFLVYVVSIWPFIILGFIIFLLRHKIGNKLRWKRKRVKQDIS